MQRIGDHDHRYAAELGEMTYEELSVWPMEAETGAEHEVSTGYDKAFDTQQLFEGQQGIEELMMQCNDPGNPLVVSRVPDDPYQSYTCESFFIQFFVDSLSFALITFHHALSN